MPNIIKIKDILIKNNKINILSSHEHIFEKRNPENNKKIRIDYL